MNAAGRPHFGSIVGGLLLSSLLCLEASAGQVVGSTAVVTTGFGAKGDGKTDDTKAIQRALDSGAVHIVVPAGDYLISATLMTHPGQLISGEGRRHSVFRKAHDGYLIDLAEWAVLQDLRFVGEATRFKGGIVVVTRGANSSDVATQGHQIISRCGFEDAASYAIEYKTPNMGWLSSVEDSTFHGIKGPAAIRWPDEPAKGGNRQVVGCYSSSALVDVGGADNGFVSRNTVGGTSSSEQGVVFPPGTMYRAKKIIITSNRFAIANGVITLRGADLIFSDNVVAGSLRLLPNQSNDGATHCRIADNNVFTGTLSDDSGADNHLEVNSRAFPIRWDASKKQPSFGDADVRCESSRRANYTVIHCFLRFGRTTTFGEGAWSFSLPGPTVNGETTDFVGSALLNGQAGVVRTTRQTRQDALQLLDSTGAPVSARSPMAWKAGDTLMFEITYRSH